MSFSAPMSNFRTFQVLKNENSNFRTFQDQLEHCEAVQARDSFSCQLDEKSRIVNVYEVTEMIMPTAISGFTVMWRRIQLIAILNRAGARTQPCLTPDVI